jgi:integral membrane protein
LRVLRAVGFAEGLSFVLLLLVAMPLKYLAGMPAAVRYVGWAHGLLFVLYVGAVGVVGYANGWSMKRMFWALVASVVPFGPFVLERDWKREQERLSGANASG